MRKKAGRPFSEENVEGLDSKKREKKRLGRTAACLRGSWPARAVRFFRRNFFVEKNLRLGIFYASLRCIPAAIRIPASTAASRAGTCAPEEASRARNQRGRSSATCFLFCFFGIVCGCDYRSVFFSLSLKYFLSLFSPSRLRLFTPFS